MKANDADNAESAESNNTPLHDPVIAVEPPSEPHKDDFSPSRPPGAAEPPQSPPSLLRITGDVIGLVGDFAKDRWEISLEKQEQQERQGRRAAELPTPRPKSGEAKAESPLAPTKIIGAVGDQFRSWQRKRSVESAKADKHEPEVSQTDDISPLRPEQITETSEDSSLETATTHLDQDSRDDEQSQAFRDYFQQLEQRPQDHPNYQPPSEPEEIPAENEEDVFIQDSQHDAFDEIARSSTAEDFAKELDALLGEATADEESADKDEAPGFSANNLPSPAITPDSGIVVEHPEADTPKLESFVTASDVAAGDIEDRTETPKLEPSTTEQFGGSEIRNSPPQPEFDPEDPFADLDD